MTEIKNIEEFRLWAMQMCLDAHAKLGLSNEEIAYWLHEIANQHALAGIIDDT